MLNLQALVAGQVFLNPPGKTVLFTAMIIHSAWTAQKCFAKDAVRTLVIFSTMDQRLLIKGFA
jgi:hypothetical protein